MPFGDNAMFPPTLCYNEKVTGMLSNSLKKVLKCDLKYSICESQSAGDKEVRWPFVNILI